MASTPDCNSANLSSNLSQPTICDGGMPKGTCSGDGYTTKEPHLCPEKGFHHEEEIANELCNCCQACEDFCAFTS